MRIHSLVDCSSLSSSKLAKARRELTGSGTWEWETRGVISYLVGDEKWNFSSVNPSAPR
jgi:hypothetical protein